MTIITSIINALREHWHYGRWLWALLWKSLAAIATSLLHRVTHTLPAHTHTQAECKAKLCIWSRCYERIQSLHTPAIYLLWLAQVSRNKGVTVAVTHTPRYTHPLPCQLSLHPLPLSPSCGYTSSKPQFHTQTHPETRISWVASGPGLTKTLSSSLLRGHCLSATLNDWLTALLGGTMFFAIHLRLISVTPLHTPTTMNSCVPRKTWWGLFLRIFSTWGSFFCCF